MLHLHVLVLLPRLRSLALGLLLYRLVPQVLRLPLVRRVRHAVLRLQSPAATRVFTQQLVERD